MQKSNLKEKRARTMIRIENHCCGCASPGYPCLGSDCSNRHVEVHYCDKCGYVIEGDVNISEINGDELCDDCFAKETEETEETEE